MTWNTKPFEPLNSAACDYHSEDGVRFSLPFYLDLSQQQRKQLFNAVRTTIAATTKSTSVPKSRSGISVETFSHGEYSLEQYIGLSIDLIRTLIHSRGGIPADMIVRIQAVTGEVIVTDAQLKKAFDTRKKYVLDYVKNNPPPSF